MRASTIVTLKQQADPTVPGSTRRSGSTNEWSRRGRRWASFAAAITPIAMAISGCAGATATPSDTTPPGTSPSTNARPSASANPVAMAGSFADLPFTLTMPDGWVFGNPKDVTAGLAALQKSDTADAKKLQALLAQSPTFTSAFIAYQVGSSDAFTPNISCNTLDRRQDLSVADTLAQGQVQNVDAIAQLPGIIGKPTADRMTLPIGEAVRVRWQWKDAASGSDAASIGYLFVAGPTVYTCVFSAGTSTIATHEPEWEAILRTFAAKPSASPSTAPSGATAAACPAPASGIFPHQAPELEAILPSIVAGRPLTRWSVRGRCWLEQVANDPAAIDQVASQFKSSSNPSPIDDTNLVYGVAGRALDTDPPFFIFAAARPANNDEIDFVSYLLFGGAGFHDIAGASDLTHYQAQTIGGKQVYVGTADMLTQDIHQRGKPYLYQTDQYLFLVITDDDAWATDAIGHLP